MKLYKTTLKPISNFGTPLKGDTLLGQSCWAIKYLFGEKRLVELLDTYENAPFLVLSDGFANGYLPKPKLPSKMLKEGEDKKANRKKIWLTFDDLQNGNFANGKTAKDVGEDKVFTTMHNSINYTTFTTGEDAFAPYGSDEISLGQKDIYCLLDEAQFSIDDLQKTFDFLATHGYGKDTTIGKGRFTLEKFEPIEVNSSSKTVMALSPFSAQEVESEKLFYEPFVRFGKKGGDRANQNPFKKPLLMADTGGVIHFKDKYQKGYVGKAIKGHSTHDDIVRQGYAIALPIKEL